MKFFLHFLRSNFKYNKLELLISYSIAFIIIGTNLYMHGFQKTDNTILVNLTFYLSMYAFYTNRKKYNLKYLLSLPISKNQLILSKGISDFIYFLPAVLVAVMAAENSSKVHFSSFYVFIILLQLIIFVGFILFDTDIETPRLENSKSSFLNRLVHIRKMINLFFFIIFSALSFMLIISANISDLLKVYFIMIILSIVLGFKFYGTLKLLIDESLSYFKPKRDLLRLSFKIAVIVIPILSFNIMGIHIPSKYGKDKIFAQIESTKSLLSKDIISKLNRNHISQKGFSPMNASILEGKEKIVDQLLNNGYKLKWNKSIRSGEERGLYPIHLAIKSGNIHLISRILDLNPSILQQRIKRKGKNWTPLQYASALCNAKVVDILLHNGAGINEIDSIGNTALNIATIKNCKTVAMLLLESGADFTIKNHKNKIAMDYINKKRNPNFYYMFERKLTKDRLYQSRSLASPSK